MPELGTVRGQIRMDVRQAVAAYAAVRAQNQRTVYALRGTGDSFVQAGKTMAVAGGGMIYLFGRVVKAAADFERKMDFFSAVSDTNAAGMEKLGDYTLQLAQDTIYSAEQIADGLIELGKSGVTAEQIMKGVGDAMANLGAAGDIPLAESGQIITSTIQQFDLAAKDATKVTDLLAGAANASIADITDIGVSLKYAGGVASAVGLSFEDTTTAISLLAKAGIRGSTAGTSLRQMLVSFGGATKPARAALEDIGVVTYNLADANKTLAKVTGGPAQKSIEGVTTALGKYVESIDGGTLGTNKNFEAVKDLLMMTGGLNNQLYDSEGNLKSLSKVYQILQDSLKGYDNKTKLAYLRTIFNNRALSAASILTRDGAKGFNKMNKEMLKTTAADVARERLDNLSGDIEILKGNLETLATKAGGPFQEMLRGWVQDLTELVQAFDNLSPKAQKMIIQTIGISGVTLTALGLFSIFVGTIFRVAAAMLKMAAGLKFLWKMLKIVIFNLKFLRLILVGPIIAAFTAITLPIALVIAALVALGVGLVVLYKKWAPFRNIVNSIGEALKSAAIAVGKFLKLLVTDPGAAWDKTKKAFWALVDMAKEAIAKVPGILRAGLNRAVDAVVKFGAMVKQKFLDIKDKVIGTITGFVSRVIGLFTFENIGYALGFLLGTVTRFFVMLPLRVLQLVLKLVLGVIKFFGMLAPKVGYLLGFLAGRILGFFIRMGINAVKLTAKLVVGVIRWFQKLPGRVAVFLAKMVAKAKAMFTRVKQDGPRIIAQAIVGIINWFKTLPSRMATWLVKTAITLDRKLDAMRAKMIRIAIKMVKGFVQGLKDLPGKVGEITDNMIQMVKDAAKAAFTAVKDFASGMWEGFKDGLGINSPSYMEKAMWQITGVLDTETKKIGKRTLEVQRLSKKMAETQFGVGGSAPDLPGRGGYAGLASMHQRNQNRARTLQEGSGKRGDNASRGATTKNIKVETTVNNPKPERASQSQSKILRTKAEEAGWS